MATSSNFLTLINGEKTLVTSINSFTGNPNEVISTDTTGLINSNLLPVDIDTFVWSVARNATNVSNQFLRRADRTPTNLAPFVTPFNAEIFYITAASQSNEDDTTTWDAIISINGGADIVLASIPGTGDQVESSVSQNLNAGDLVSIGMANQTQTVNRPYIDLYIRRRV